MLLLEGIEIIGGVMVKITKPFFIYKNEPDGSKSLAVVPTDASIENPWYLAILENQTPVVKDSMELLMVEFDRLGFIMPEQDQWDFPERPLRLAIPNDDIPGIILAVPTVALKLEALKDFIVERNRIQHIYLNSIDEEDQPLYNKYGSPRP